MNWVDIVIIVIWALLALWGFRAGLIRMLLPLVAVVLGLFLASHYAGPVGNLFSPFTGHKNVQTIVAFIAIFMVVFIVAALLTLVLRKVMSFLIIFGLLDRLAGLAVGIVIGFVLLSGVLTALQKYPVVGIQDDINRSQLARFLIDHFSVITRAVKLVPADWGHRLKRTEIQL